MIGLVKPMKQEPKMNLNDTKSFLLEYKLWYLELAKFVLTNYSANEEFRGIIKTIGKNYKQYEKRVFTQPSRQLNPKIESYLRSGIPR